MADEDRPQYQHGVGTIGGTQFHWGSGMPGKYWSIPYGDYPVTPNAPTGAWAQSVGAIPIANNVIPDPQLNRDRIGIMIHSGSAPDLDTLYTQGCFKVAPQEWPAVRSQILAEADKGPLYLHVAPGGVAAFTNTKTFSQAGGETPAANANAAANTTAAPAASSASSSSTPGTTLNSNNVIDTLSRNIAGIESGGFKNPYEALNPTTNAIGKYQVLPSNVPGWTQAALGKSMTPDEFKASPSAQEAVFRDQMQRNLQLYGPKDAASIWFTGKPYNVAGGAASDANNTTNASYVARATAGLPDSGTFTPKTPGTTLNAAGAPTTPAGAPAAPAATPAPSGGLAGQLASALKPLSDAKGGGGGGGDQPQVQPLQMAQSRAMGGPMMMGAGGQNTFGARAAENSLAQQGYMMQPTLAAFGGGGVQPVVPSTIQSTIQPMAAGQATGMPAMPGTTLNSPSQLQMALMSGSLSPYDMYARQAGGFGST